MCSIGSAFAPRKYIIASSCGSALRSPRNTAPTELGSARREELEDTKCSTIHTHATKDFGEEERKEENGEEVRNS